MKKILLLILSSISLSAYAFDTYTNGQLSIPTVQVGPNTYTNVVVTLGTIVSIGTGAPNGFIDTYNLTTGPVENTFVITIPNMATIALLPVNSNKTFLMQIQNDRGTGVCQAL